LVSILASTFVYQTPSLNNSIKLSSKNILSSRSVLHSVNRDFTVLRTGYTVHECTNGRNTCGTHRTDGNCQIFRIKFRAGPCYYKIPLSNFNCTNFVFSLTEYRYSTNTAFRLHTHVNSVSPCIRKCEIIRVKNASLFPSSSIFHAVKKHQL